MGRVIKFRAWDKREEKMLFPYTDGHLAIGSHTWGFWDDEKALTCDNNTGTLMQFTGLLDKNGKEIFEGDILTVNENGKYTAICEVVFDNHHSCFTTHPLWTIWKHQRMEIIGNIFEDPELLTF